MDRQIWTWDLAWYGEQSLRLFHSNFLKILDVGEVKAPGLMWLGAVSLGVLRGVQTETALLVIPMLGIILSAFLIYSSISRFSSKDSAAPFLGALILLGSPLAFGMGTHFFTEALQIFSVSMAIHLSNQDFLDKETALLKFITLIFFAEIVKISSMIYLIAPGITLLYQIRTSSAPIIGRSRPKRVAWIAICGIIGLLVTSWYWRNGARVIGFVKSVSTGEYAQLYGSEGTLIHKLAIWMTSFSSAINANVAWMKYTLIAMAFALTTAEGRLMTKARITGFIHLGNIALAIFFLAKQTNEETRYLAPLIPMWAFCCAILIEGSKFKIKIALALVVITLGNYGILVAHVFNKNVNYSGNHWAEPFHSFASEKAIFQELSESLCNQIKDGTVIFGVDDYYFNYNSALFYSKLAIGKRGENCRFTKIGIGTRGWAEFLHEIEDPSTKGFITYLNPLNFGSDRLNENSKAALELMIKRQDFKWTRNGNYLFGIRSKP